MKRITIFLIFLALVLVSSTSKAEELIIHLKSGNSIHVKYDGVIQGVTFQGEGDAITGISMPQATIQPAVHQTRTSKSASAASSKDEKDKKKKGTFFRLKWAKPIDDY